MVRESKKRLMTRATQLHPRERPYQTQHIAHMSPIIKPLPIRRRVRRFYQDIQYDYFMIPVLDLNLFALCAVLRLYPRELQIWLHCVCTTWAVWAVPTSRSTGMCQHHRGRFPLYRFSTGACGHRRMESPRWPQPASAHFYSADVWVSRSVEVY